MFRDRARSRRRAEASDRPLRLVSVPARLSLAAAVLVVVGGGLWLFGGHVAVKASATGVLVNPPGNAVVATPVGGIVTDALTPVGTHVGLGQVVAQVRRADGDLEHLHAPTAGTVISLSTEASAAVRAGDTLLTIAPASGPMAALLFVPAQAVADVVPGLRAEVAPTTLDVSRTGVLLGSVAEVSPLPVTRQRLTLVLGDDGLAGDLLRDGPVHEVVVEFAPDLTAPLGLRWSGPGPAAGQRITSGVIAVGQFVLREQSPWQALLGEDSGTPRPRPGADVVPEPEPSAPQALPVTGALHVGHATIGLEVARSPRQQEVGLMFRTQLSPDRGMAFVLDHQAPVSFWMKNTLVPLDMIFLRDGVVLNVAAQAPPCEEDPCPTYPSQGRVDTVVELAAGRAAALGLVAGTRVDLRYH